MRYPAISGDQYYNTLQWVNPIDEDFDKVVITRKDSSAPLYQGDGDIVYEGYEPAHPDLTGTSGVEYYYLVQTVDYSGNASSGVVLSKVQP